MSFTFAVALDGLDILDRSATHAARDVRTPWLDNLGWAVGELGNIEVTVLIGLVVAAFLWRRNPRDAVIMLLLLAALTLVGLVLKHWLPHPGVPAEWHQARPEGVYPRVQVTTPNAYPSGHMARTTFLVATIVMLVPSRRAMGAGLLWLTLMGLTRVYMGDHWVSDVLGGLLLGASAAALMWWRTSDVSAAQAQLRDTHRDSPTVAPHRPQSHGDEAASGFSLPP